MQLLFVDRDEPGAGRGTIEMRLLVLLATHEGTPVAFFLKLGSMIAAAIQNAYYSFAQSSRPALGHFVRSVSHSPIFSDLIVFKFGCMPAPECELKKNEVFLNVSSSVTPMSLEYGLTDALLAYKD